MADRSQCLRALGMLCVPWRWQHGESNQLLQRELATTFQGSAFLFSSGRGALLAILRAMKLQQDDEVVVQAYTCIAVPNAVHAAGLRPVFVDIEQETLNMDCEAVQSAITPRTRAIVCQHTFGIPADTETLRRLCDEHGLLLIEDCAHILPDPSAGPFEVGKYADVLMLSFGRDKAISGVSGGGLVIRKPELARRVETLRLESGHVPLLTIARLLLYPLLYCIARPVYGIGIGKIFLKLMQMLQLFIPIYVDDEKEGHMPPVFPHLPNACAFLALAQWRILRSINDHRRALTRFYLEEGKKYVWVRSLLGITPDLPLQKFPMFIANADAIRTALKRKNIFLDDGWTGCVICPPSIDLAITNYEPGSDPNAEESSKKILSLPTHPGMTRKQAKYLLRQIDLVSDK